MNQGKEIVYRLAEQEDLSGIASVDAVCFSAPWPVSEFEQMYSLAVYRFFVAEQEGRIVGYLSMTLVFEEAEVIRVGILPDVRRRGIGKELMLYGVSALQKEKAEILMLEVRESNTPARTLYDSLGFIVEGIRSDYYSNPKESAILMRLDLAELDLKMRNLC